MKNTIQALVLLLHINHLISCNGGCYKKANSREPNREFPELAHHLVYFPVVD